MEYTVKEKDWKLFRKKLPGWQEAFMGRLLDEYSELLQEDVNASEKFWKLKERIDEDIQKSGVAVDSPRRSTMVRELYSLLNEGAISLEDLSEFSTELQETAAEFLEP